MSTPRNSTAWVPYAGLLLAVGGIIYTAGSVGGQVKSNTDRIVKLEASDAARSDGLNAINVRTARMEAKLDFLLPATAAGDRMSDRGDRDRRDSMRGPVQ